MKFFREHLFFSLLILIPFIIQASGDNQEVLKKQEPLGQEKKLVVYVSYGNGFVSFNKTSSNNIFEGEFAYEKYRPNVRYEVVGNEGRLNVFFSGKIKKGSEDKESQSLSSIKKIYDNELRLNLSPEVAIDLNLELGVVKGEMDFSGLKISNLDLEVGVSQTTILFDEPNPMSLESCSIEGGVGKLMIEKLGNANFRKLSFEGGVGSYVLDFGGQYRQNANANIELGMGKLTLYLPRYVGTRIKVDKSFLSSFSIDECYKKSNYYYNENWEKTEYHLDLKVETGIGKVEVIWVDE